MEEKNNNNKKKIILVLIAVLTILLVIGGATYAFYTVQVNNSSTPTNFNTNTEVVGNATLKMLTDSLHINVTAQDMAEGNKGNDYYGTKDATKSYEREQEKATYNLVEVDMKDGGSTTKYVCSATIKVSVEGEMVSGLKAKDLILSLNGGNLEEELDIYSIKETREKSYNVNFNIEGNTTHTIKGYLKLSNRNEDQTDLANKSLNVKLNSTKIECNVVTEFPKSTLEYLRENDENNFITEDLVGGLYRYQGTDNVNNWICFGADEETCNKASTDNTVVDKYMYRIIGITNDGQLKLIKINAKNMNYNNKYYQDHHSTSSTELYNYKNSEIRTSFNGSDFLSNTQYIPEGWENKIADHTWLYGYVGTVDQTNLYNGEYMYKIENGEIEVTYNDGSENVTKAWDETITDKIGLIYIHDYLYAYPGGNPGNSTNARNVWISVSGWSMSYLGINSGATYVYYIGNGNISAFKYNNGATTFVPPGSREACTYNCNAKCGWSSAVPGYWDCFNSCKSSCPVDYSGGSLATPVFYLKSTEKISGGTGSKEQPYIIQQ